MANLKIGYVLIWTLLLFGIFAAITVDVNAREISVKTNTTASRQQVDVNTKTMVGREAVNCTKSVNNSCITFVCSDGTQYNTCNMCTPPTKTNQTVRRLPTTIQTRVTAEKGKTRSNAIFNESVLVNKTAENQTLKSNDFFTTIFSWFGGQTKSEPTKQPPASCREESIDGCEFKYCPINGKEELVHLTCPSIGYGIEWWTWSGACEYKAVGYNNWNKAQCKVTCEKPSQFPGATGNMDCPAWMKIPDWKSGANNTEDYFSPFAE
ncbi:MAG: hypothetical protein ACP5N9_06470 [Candidatus Bilamarchaeum sp.]|jgi:hypothetical protein